MNIVVIILGVLLLVAIIGGIMWLNKQIIFKGIIRLTIGIALLWLSFHFATQNADNGTVGVPAVIGFIFLCSGFSYLSKCKCPSCKHFSMETTKDDEFVRHVKTIRKKVNGEWCDVDVNKYNSMFECRRCGQRVVDGSYNKEEV